MSSNRLSPDVVDPRNALELYTRTALRNMPELWTDVFIRSEYSRLRDIARKRLKRLAVEEPESYAYRENKNAFAPARGQSTEELRALLPQLARFIAAKTGTVSGIRAARNKAVQTLQEHGYTGVTRENFKQFSQFMEEWRAKKLQHTVGSPDVVEFFEFTQEQQIPWEKIRDSFAQWLKYNEKLAEWVEKQTERGKSVSSGDIINRFNTLEGQRLNRNVKARQRRAAKRSNK